MGKLSKYLYGIMAAAMLAGCSDDGIAPDVDGGKPINGDGGSVYMQVTIVPSLGSNGSRSVTDEPDENGYSTSNSGIEIGSVDENKIYNVMLILAGPNNEFISYGLIGGLGNNNQNPSGMGKPDGSVTPPDNNSVTVNASFNRASIDNFYAYAEVQKIDPTQVYVYALCNYTQAMLNSIKTATPLTSNWANFVQQVDEYSEASGIPNTGISILDPKGGLYMANGTLAPKQFPKEAQDWDTFSNEKNPFDLSGVSTIQIDETRTQEINNTGTVRVERGMARFDFADGSAKNDKVNPDWKAGDETTWNTYIIGDPDENDKTPKTLKVKLVRMCLVNMSNRFYYLRHMSDTNGLEGQAAAALLPDDAYDPVTDVAPELWASFFLCVAEQPWYTGGKWVDDKWIPGTQNWNGNWVIDPDYSWKAQFATISDVTAEDFHYEQYFNFPLGNRGFNEDTGEITGDGWGITPSARKGWYTSKINDVLKGREDQNFGNWSPDAYDYRVWRYVTENTIPSVAAQKNAISTGIVFKGLLLPGPDLKEDSDLYEALTTGKYTDEKGNTINYPNLYLFDDVLYVSWSNVEAEALAQKAGSPLYNAVYGNTPMTAEGHIGDLDGSTEETKDRPCAAYLYQVWMEKTPGQVTGDYYNAFRTAIVNNGFAIYQHSREDELDDDDAADTEGKGGYFCYYYYWNRHNDNGRNGVMGPMEFQVVRNNVYKLAVTEISKIGHPRRTPNDPDPEEPTKDDEESKLYFKVQVEVLPWAVRVNNITF